MAQSQLKRAVMCTMVYSLSSSEIEEFEAIFKRLDKNQKGTITVEEFKEAMGESLVMTNQEMVSMFKMIDSGQHGEIAYSEFVASLLQTRITMNEDVLRDVFDRIDKDRKGVITLEDFEDIL